MTIASFDRRTTPARPDLAAAHLEGKVEASAFSAGEVRTAIDPLAPLRRDPRSDCPLDTELLRGERATVYEEAEGWAWVQLARDGYVGYVPSAALGPPERVTHRVSALRTLVFPGPDLKLPVVAALTLGSELEVRRVSGSYAEVADGWLWSGHLAPLDQAAEPDFVAVAERFLGVPYLWGGRSSLGLDCSGLVQVSLQAAGTQAPRDSDMQQRDLGTAVDPGGQLQRGDLVFWKGHVGIMRDAETLLHATAHSMMVSSERFVEARDRISGKAGLTVAAIKRLAGAPETT